MAPALPVYTREEIRTISPNLYPDRLGLSKHQLSLDNCKLYSLTQNQCTFDGNQIVCIPFKRMFARCLDKDFNKRKEVIGYKLTPTHRLKRKQKDLSDDGVYRNIEITDWYDNDYGKVNDGLVDKDVAKVNGEEVIIDKELLQEFLKADKVLHQKMKEYYESLVKK